MSNFIGNSMQDDYDYWDYEDEVITPQYTPMNVAERVKQALNIVENVISASVVRHYREMCFKQPDGTIKSGYDSEQLYYTYISDSTGLLEYFPSSLTTLAEIHCIKGSTAEDFLSANLLSDSPVYLEKYFIPGKYLIFKREIISQNSYRTLVVFYAKRIY